MIKKVAEIPGQSILRKDKKMFHYVDSFQSNYEVEGQGYDITDMGKIFFASSPKWADKLMAMRDKAVGMFGLKTTSQLTAEQMNINNFKFEPGEQLGIFKLYARTATELIMGEDDKHLSFRFSLLLEAVDDAPGSQRVALTTVVEFKNVFGRLYFLPVKPFHQLIVKSTLKEMLQKIKSTRTSGK